MSVGSGIEGLRADSAFARLVAGALVDEAFRLIDVGCAGGPAPGWRVFGDRLKAICFDGDGEEIDRLTAAEENPAVRYHHGLIGVPDAHPLHGRIAGRPFWTGFGHGRLAYERHHDLRAARAAGREPRALLDYVLACAKGCRDQPRATVDTDYTAAFDDYEVSAAEVRAAVDPDRSGPIYLPAFLQAARFDDADFLKIDIDGPDYEVLRSCSSLLKQPSLLGVAVEVCFFGSHDANDNTFHNVDRLMRQKGFDLFALSVRNYAAAALPAPYLSAYPSLNLTGRPIQGDAVYLRDLSSPFCWPQAQAVSAEKLAKLAALFSLFNLADHAAELLLVHGDRLGRVLDCQAGLEMLTRQVQEDTGAPVAGFDDYIAAFEREDSRFFDIYSRREKWLARLVKAARDRSDLMARVASLEAERDTLKAEIAALKVYRRSPVRAIMDKIMN